MTINDAEEAERADRDEEAHGVHGSVLHVCRVEATSKLALRDLACCLVRPWGRATVRHRTPAARYPTGGPSFLHTANTSMAAQQQGQQQKQASRQVPRPPALAHLQWQLLAPGFPLLGLEV